MASASIKLGLSIELVDFLYAYVHAKRSATIRQSCWLALRVGRSESMLLMELFTVRGALRWWLWFLRLLGVVNLFRNELSGSFFKQRAEVGFCLFAFLLRIA